MEEIKIEVTCECPVYCAYCDGVTTPKVYGDEIYNVCEECNAITNI